MLNFHVGEGLFIFDKWRKEMSEDLGQPQTMVKLETLVKGLSILNRLDSKARYHIFDDSLIVKTSIVPSDIPLEEFETLGEMGFVCESWDGSWVVYG